MVSSLQHLWIGPAGKVIDAEILSKHCRCKNKFIGQNSEKCCANYQGVSEGMEVAGAQAIFQRLVPSYNLQYIEYLGDGDSKGLQVV